MLTIVLCPLNQLLLTFYHILGDSVELWVTLSSMGYNHALVQDEVAMFEVNMFSFKISEFLVASSLSDCNNRFLLPITRHQRGLFNVFSSELNKVTPFCLEYHIMTASLLSSILELFICMQY